MTSARTAMWDGTARDGSKTVSYVYLLLSLWVRVPIVRPLNGSAERWPLLGDQRARAAFHIIRRHISSLVDFVTDSQNDVITN